ncbi:hypothetical protein N8198_07085 [Gammaproteobacteria bacterium]|nr:hypothetical protein [Gammaproteobacteria bacterium]
MLREIKNVSRKKNEPEKRWFSSSSMDLFIWFDTDNSIVGYQFTYDKPHNEKALVWSVENGLSHMKVDDGSGSGKHPGSPLLVQDGVANPDKIISMLRKNIGGLEPAIENFIVSNIEEYFQ